MLSFISDHFSTLLALIGALHAVAVIIVQFTPTQIDDAVLRRVWQVVELMAGLVTQAAKQNTPLKPD